MRKIYILFFLFFIPLTCVSSQEIRATGVAVDKLKILPILHEGRIKPLDTYARHIVLKFSGKGHVNKESALTWLMTLLLDPIQTQRDNIFLVNHPDVLSAIDIDSKKKRRYSFKELEPGVARLSELSENIRNLPDQQQGLVEKEILRLTENIYLYINLSQAFQFVFPHPDFTLKNKELANRLGIAAHQPNSFLDFVWKADQLSQFTEPLQERSMQQWNQQEQEMVKMLGTMMLWSMQYNDVSFHVIPSQKEKDKWLSPPQAINEEFPNLYIREQISLWDDLIKAYWKGQQVKFDLSAKKLWVAINHQTKQTISPNRLKWEIFYNQSHLFLWTQLIYGLSFIIFLLSLIFSKLNSRFISLWCLFIGLLPHTGAIALRVLILQRPPVSTLYETFIFVAWIVVVLGIIIEAVHRKWLGVIVSSLGGIILLQIASKYSAEGDTMGMLIAVLNSNFWLLTHVLTITAGYGACCVAGLIGHVYLIQRAFSKNIVLLKDTLSMLLGSLGLGLALTFLGTNLGGIWADQSWGRFWGWDPKENGALMIVLWTAMLLHARIGNIIGPIGLAVGSVLGLIVVMWAWFGVNLLSIGLHSYGFTSGLAISLGIYVAIEVVFLLGVMSFLKQKRN